MAEPNVEWGKQLSRQVDALDADVAILKTDVSAMRQEFQEFRTQAQMFIGVVRGVGGLLSGSLILAGLAAVYSAGMLKATVDGHTQQLADMRQDIKDVLAEVGSLRAELGARFDRLEARLDRPIPPPEPKTGAGR